MEVIHVRCAGMDISKRDAKVCVRHAGAGRRKTVETVTTWSSMTGQILALRAQVMLVNARHVKTLPGRKTDVADATWLAQLGAHGWPNAHRPPRVPRPGAPGPDRPAHDLICTIPGISTITADIIVAETGADMTRFPTAKHLASWAGPHRGTTSLRARWSRREPGRGTPTYKEHSARQRWRARRTGRPTSVPATGASPVGADR